MTQLDVRGESFHLDARAAMITDYQDKLVLKIKGNVIITPMSYETNHQKANNDGTLFITQFIRASMKSQTRNEKS